MLTYRASTYCISLGVSFPTWLLCVYVLAQFESTLHVFENVGISRLLQCDTAVVHVPKGESADPSALCWWGVSLWGQPIHQLEGLIKNKYRMSRARWVLRRTPMDTQTYLMELSLSLHLAIHAALRKNITTGTKYGYKPAVSRHFKKEKKKCNWDVTSVTPP